MCRVSGFFLICIFCLAGKRLSGWTFAFARMPRGIAKLGKQKLEMCEFFSLFFNWFRVESETKKSLGRSKTKKKEKRIVEQKTDSETVTKRL